MQHTETICRTTTRPEEVAALRECLLGKPWTGLVLPIDGTVPGKGWVCTEVREWRSPSFPDVVRVEAIYKPRGA